MLLGIGQTPLVGHEKGLFREKDAGFAGRTKSCCMPFLVLPIGGKRGGSLLLRVSHGSRLSTYRRLLRD